MEEQRVVLDTDFIKGITEYKAGDGADLFRRVFRTLGMTPVVHPYVAEHELLYSKAAKELIQSGDLKVIPYEEFLPAGDVVRKRVYRGNFEAVYQVLRAETLAKKGEGQRLPSTEGVDIFARHGQMSFGEVHSILMAVELGIPLFYSNDGGAKTGARRYGDGKLTVHNAEKVAELLEKEGSEVENEERKFIRNIYRRNQHQ